jgi:hypothetical protein
MFYLFAVYDASAGVSTGGGGARINGGASNESVVP